MLIYTQSRPNKGPQHISKENINHTNLCIMVLVCFTDAVKCEIYVIILEY